MPKTCDNGLKEGRTGGHDPGGTAMSIAAISSSFVAAVRETAAPPAAVAATRPAEPRQSEGGRRHQLVDAMQQVLGTDHEPDQGQAVFRFAHALMHDLRSLDGDAPAQGPGRGHAWGRRSWSDLSQRIDTLAAAAAKPVGTAAPPPTPTPTPTPEVAAIAADAAGLRAVVTAPELPLQPNPITTTSAAVHLMQVPTSRLLEAFAALHTALGQAAGLDGAPPPPAADERGELAAFLQRLSERLGQGAPASVPAGSVVNLTA